MRAGFHLKVLCFLPWMAWLAACHPPQTDSQAPPILSEQEALQRIRAKFPLAPRIRNDLLPEAPHSPVPRWNSVTKLKVGMPWILNDECAPWLIARERGYFTEAGLDVEILPGGPMADHLMTLTSGAVDIAVTNQASRALVLMTSPAGSNAVFLGAVLQRSPAIYLTLDNSIPKTERSTRRFTPKDWIGKKIGEPPESQFLVHYVIWKHQLPPGSVTILPSGNGMNALLSGTVDFQGSWIVNQPRLLEAAGQMNWSYLDFSEYGFNDYMDVSVVRQDWLEANVEIVKRYNWALEKALNDLLRDPATCADITFKALPPETLTRAQILRRFELQKSYIQPTPEARLQALEPERLEKILAALLQMGKVTIE